MIEPIKIECKNCKSIFSFNYEDIRREERNGIFSTQIARFVICPVCKEENPMIKIEVCEETEREDRKRPCESCEFHTEKGCSKWDCVFEGSDKK